MNPESAQASRPASSRASDPGTAADRARSKTPSARRQAHQQAWYLRAADPAHNRALWLRFTLLSSQNGFRRVAETCAILFTRPDGRETQKIAVKQSHDLSQFLPVGEGTAGGARIAGSLLAPDQSRGEITAKGRSIAWDFRITPSARGGVSLVPGALARAGLTRVGASSLVEDLRLTGTVTVDGETSRWEQVPGTLGRFEGPHRGHSWVWAQCNTFLDERGEPVYALFEGFSLRAGAGTLARYLPRLSSFYFHYQGQDYRLNTVWAALRSRSRPALNAWRFEAETGDLSFRGELRAEHRDFAGTTYEDTDGTLLHGSNSQIADMTLLVYRRGKLERTLSAKGSAGLEVVTRSPNPYVPALV